MDWCLGVLLPVLNTVQTVLLAYIAAKTQQAPTAKEIGDDVHRPGRQPGSFDEPRRKE